MSNRNTFSSTRATAGSISPSVPRSSTKIGLSSRPFRRRRSDGHRQWVSVTGGTHDHVCLALSRNQRLERFGPAHPSVVPARFPVRNHGRRQPNPARLRPSGSGSDSSAISPDPITSTILSSKRSKIPLANSPTATLARKYGLRTGRFPCGPVRTPGSPAETENAQRSARLVFLLRQSVRFLDLVHNLGLAQHHLSMLEATWNRCLTPRVRPFKQIVKELRDGNGVELRHELGQFTRRRTLLHFPGRHTSPLGCTSTTAQPRIRESDVEAGCRCGRTSADENARRSRTLNSAV